ncbi:hypothetical protein MHTCC0001_09150 [Flavobacteriaceae bacterium MHTCC 0001]
MLFYINSIHAQLGFCTGNSGTPIFTETFGTGITSTPLAPETTGYTFDPGDPFDGFYKVSSNTNSFNWFDIDDHTPNDVDGKMLIINADFDPGEFYRASISGLCENTTYEFSSWMINLSPSFDCGGASIPINLSFEIWDSLDANLLASGDTGSINGTVSPTWIQYALVFQTLPSQTSVILKMRNNGVGGCGNDLAIDDIVFKSCGDLVNIEETFNNNRVDICGDQLPYTAQLTALPDFTVFSTHFYQWQESDDNMNWIDILGETTATYTTPQLMADKYYRVKVAENAINVNNNLCNTLSEVFELNVVSLPAPPNSNGDLSICEGDNTPLSVTTPNGITANWYDASVGGNLLLANSTTYSPGVSGTYFAEAQTTIGNCISPTRTPLEITYLQEPEVDDEQFEFCENTNRELHANVINTSSINVTYLWRNTGQTSESINVNAPGTYMVDVSNGNCTVTKTIVLNQIDNPVISNVDSDGNDIVVTTANSGDFVYALNSGNFIANHIFSNIEGGLYTVSVKERNCPEVITTTHLHFYVPKFFTPNGDNKNDTWDLLGIAYFGTSTVSIFDRYGKLLKYSKNRPFKWDGTFNNQHLPTGDYWYIIVVDGQRLTGHFTLKR